MFLVPACPFRRSCLPTKGMFTVPFLGISGTTRKETLALERVGATYMRRYEEQVLVAAEVGLVCQALLLVVLPLEL